MPKNGGREPISSKSGMACGLEDEDEDKNFIYYASPLSSSENKTPP